MSRSIAALFQRLTQGVYVVGVAHGAVRNAFTAAWVMQFPLRPLAADLEHQSASFVLPAAEGEFRAFSVNVLKKGQLDLAEARYIPVDQSCWLCAGGRDSARGRHRLDRVWRCGHSTCSGGGGGSCADHNRGAHRIGRLLVACEPLLPPSNDFASRESP